MEENLLNEKEEGAVEAKSSRMKTAWFLVLTFAFIFVGIDVGIIISSQSQKSPVVELTVSAYTAGEVSKRIFRNDYSFFEIHENAKETQTTINEKISASQHIKLVYAIKKNVNSSMKFSFAFADAQMVNCNVFYSLDGAELVPLDGGGVEVDCASTSELDIYIMIANVSNDSSFFANAVFNIWAQ
ncbi:MAG: hypothetical protein IJS68_03115 [Clostridia bacterium]|nr:hypothetical protein [Clostridia bacterium]